jgi:ABC-type uncharacterized transport system substrate-binding protein
MGVDVAQAQSLPGDAGVVIVSSSNSGAYVEATQSLVAALVNTGVSRTDLVQFSVTEIAARLRLGPAPAARLYLALGSEATQLLADTKVAAPVLSALIPGGSFEQIMRTHARRASSQFTALLLDQPLKRQLALIHLAFPQAKRVGVLLGPDSSAKVSRLRSVAFAQGISVHEEQIDAPVKIFAGLQAVLDDSDVILALADPLIFNSSSIQNILLSSFAARIPLVAFSPAYVRAGALLAVYTTPAQVGSQMAALVSDFLRGKNLPDVVIEPDAFEVGVNQHVARSFGLMLEATWLQASLRSLEGLR